MFFKQTHRKGIRIIIFSLACLLLLEFSYRYVLFSQQKISSVFINPIHYADPLLGWAPEIKEAGRGTFHILFLGDSFSQSFPDQIKLFYYDYIRKSLPNTRSTTISCGGYGTYQEYLAMDTYIPTTPNIIIVQMCTNDIINNFWVLDSQEAYFTKGFYFRPYYEHEKTILRFTYPYSSGIEKYSWLYCFVVSRLVHGINWQKVNRTAAYTAAQKNTEKILQLIKNKYKNVPVLIFSATNNKKNNETAMYTEWAAHTGCIYIPHVYTYIKNVAKQDNQEYLLKDQCHWNAYGHKKAGEYIAKYLVENGYLK